MTRTIWKFPLEITREQVIDLPKDAYILSVQAQDGVPTIWAKVDPSADVVPTTIVLRGTGQPFDAADDEDYHIGTVQIDGDVWHAFERFADD